MPAALLPAALLLLFGAWAGTFPGGAVFWGALTGSVALLATALYAGDRLADPLRLGAVGRWLPIGLWATVAASAAASPVGRAGLLGALLLPAFLLVPAAVERAWPDAQRARLGLAAVAGVMILVAAWGLGSRFLGRAPRAAMPLGHHALLAGFLVALLPLAVLLAARRERGPEAAPLRLVGGAAAALSLAAIAASGSLLAAAAVAAQVLLALLWRGGLHRLLLPSALLILGLQMPRVASIFAGADPSTRARMTYLEAGWRGVAERPWLGWGPGSTPWTIATHLRPVAGVNPPSEVVGDLHSLPLQILYELGGIGFAFTLGTAAFFLRRRLARRAEAADPDLLAAGLIGLLGAAVTRLGGASLAVTALPLTVGIAAGAALAGARPPGGATAGDPRVGRRGWWWVASSVYVVAVAAVLARPLGAQRAYELARAAAMAGEAAAARQLVDRAVTLDPGFPLYRARRAWLEPVEGGDAATAADRAARQAPGLAPLWLEAGVRRLAGATVTDREEARKALLRAAALDPLAASPPFWLAVAAARAGEGAAGAGAWAAQALAAEPRLLAAAEWRRRPEILAAALERLEADDRLDAGWRIALLAAAERLRASPGGEADGVISLDLDAPEAAAASFSLYAFRRRPWPARLAPIPVDVERAQAIRLGPALAAPPPRP